MEQFKIQLNKRKIIAIIRNVEKEKVVDTAKALYDGGIRFVEVTFNQSSSSCNADTYYGLKEISKQFENKMFVGAGTVMTNEQVELAVDAGARYIISPNINQQVIQHTKKAKALSMPGALTPSEIAMAYDCGADYVKLFPAGTLGVPYIKAIRGPISHIPILAVGGINQSNLLEYMGTGIAGVGIGSNIVDRTLISEGRFDDLAVSAKRYTEQIKKILNN